jgi:hypothetical protein
MGLNPLDNGTQTKELRDTVATYTLPEWVECPDETCRKSTRVELDQIEFVDVDSSVYQPMADRWTPG